MQMNYNNYKEKEKIPLKQIYWYVLFKILTSPCTEKGWETL